MSIGFLLVLNRLALLCNRKARGYSAFGGAAKGEGYAYSLFPRRRPVCAAAVCMPGVGGPPPPPPPRGPRRPPAASARPGPPPQTADGRRALCSANVKKTKKHVKMRYEKIEILFSRHAAGEFLKTVAGAAGMARECVLRPFRRNFGAELAALGRKQRFFVRRIVFL